MIGVLHGYFLDGSGSNLWTRAMVQALARLGRDVHLVCQENHPERYDFIARALRYHPDGSVEPFYERQTPYPGRVVLHKPQIGTMLPVYVDDRYEEFSRAVRMPDLTEEELAAYLDRNVSVVRQLIEEHGVRSIHANHTVLMPTVAQRACAGTDARFAVMPHGSAIEYAVKKDPRMHRLAADALRAAAEIFYVGPELRERMLSVFAEVSGLEDRLVELNLGADTSLFDVVASGQRKERLATLRAGLEGLSRGRPAQPSSLDELLAGPVDRTAYDARLREASEYWAQAPDADLEDKLGAIDPLADRMVLFVGRLIAAKGIGALLSAMPSILEAAPRARFVIVGHGPAREIAEAFVCAVHNGRADWARAILEWGSILEGTAGAPMPDAVAHWQALDEAGTLESALMAARGRIADRVTFTGYLTHAELRHLFPCCETAVFPSVVAEAGPLVFLEALACGVWPIGTYYAGMGASIDAVATSLPPGSAEGMKLSKDVDTLGADIARRVPVALAAGPVHRETLRRIAVERYDWQSVAARWAERLNGLTS